MKTSTTPALSTSSTFGIESCSAPVSIINNEPQLPNGDTFVAGAGFQIAKRSSHIVVIRSSRPDLEPQEIVRADMNHRAILSRFLNDNRCAPGCLAFAAGHFKQKPTVDIVHAKIFLTAKTLESSTSRIINGDCNLTVVASDNVMVYEVGAA